MREHRLILGTAGHIDHGKTALVRALTGVDTDRLKEEKARGITIELGFAELTGAEQGLRFGVVDVPGHEAFVRAMLAGAAGMDVVLLVVAADEGVMPQTREHFGIVRLLGVPRLVVAYTKSDLVEAEWLELVEADVDALLEGTDYANAPRVATSTMDGRGLDELRARLFEEAESAPERAEADLARIPLDRVFTIQGTGTVVTGTLWSGALKTGEKVRLLPQDLEARVRALEVHGRPADEALAGERTAVALSGSGADRDRVDRGSVLVSSDVWKASSMLTVWLHVLPDSSWSVEHNQRVHVHHGTAQVLARAVIFEHGGALLPGDSGWIQLRLEAPLVPRGRDRLVLRSYSPVTTIAGGVVVESHAPKRKALGAQERATLREALEGDDTQAVAAHLLLAGWTGVARDALPVRVGLTESRVTAALESLAGRGVRVTGEHAFASEIWVQARDAVLRAVHQAHEREPLRFLLPLAALRSSVPDWAADGLADAVLAELVEDGSLVREDGGVRAPEHEPGLTGDQADAVDRLREVLNEGGLAPPFVEELPEDLTGRSDLWALLHWLEREGTVEQVADDLYVATTALRDGQARVREVLGGREGLGPADFREALDVTRKHLIPLLNFFDHRGVTLRLADGRTVPK
jgi:selenocysteine-specific elongation factor